MATRPSSATPASTTSRMGPHSAPPLASTPQSPHEAAPLAHASPTHTEGAARDSWPVKSSTPNDTRPSISAPSKR